MKLKKRTVLGIVDLLKEEWCQQSVKLAGP